MTNTYLHRYVSPPPVQHSQLALDALRQWTGKKKRYIGKRTTNGIHVERGKRKLKKCVNDLFGPGLNSRHTIGSSLLRMDDKFTLLDQPDYVFVVLQRRQ
jgi:hypothetical protein